jgi:hypothetical protein
MKSEKNFVVEMKAHFEAARTLLDLYHKGAFSVVWSGPKQAFVIQNPKRLR